MRHERTTPLTASTADPSVCVAGGYGIRVYVHNGRLIVDDGIGRNRRVREFPRVRPGISRLVVLGHAGTITFEAIRWLSDLGIGYVHLDRDGTILASTDNGPGDARLRRLQAQAATTTIGLEVGRYILERKLEGQRRNLDLIHNSERAQVAIDYWVRQILGAATLGDLLVAEREAAAAYWAAWSPLALSFASHGRDRVPVHWHRVGTRHSPLSNGPRVAVTPANAILNYLYAILEAETRIACLALGLDPGLGIWHADYRSRDSFVLDLMEAARPAVDRGVLELLSSRTFKRTDFAETSRGICRIRSPLNHELAQTAAHWRKTIAPHAEHVAAVLAESRGSRIDHLATPLTRRNRIGGQDHKRRPPRPARETANVAPSCRRCGESVPRRERVYCDACLALPQAERRRSFNDPDAARNGAGSQASRTCKTCGKPVPHRKRVYCDACFAGYEAKLRSMRRPCRRCQKPVPNRKRVYCDDCFGNSAPKPSGAGLIARLDEAQNTDGGQLA